MHIWKQKNRYCDIAELILWLDANVDCINHNLPDTENLDYDELFQKLKESRYVSIDRFEEAFDRLQGFFASKKDVELSQTHKMDEEEAKYKLPKSYEEW